MKGLILCAGRGLGLLPFTLTTPKPALPVANKPLIYYSLQKLWEADIFDIGIVIGPSGAAIKNVIEDFNFPGMKVTFITQKKPLGIAAAVAEAKEFIDGAPFVLMLGDNVFGENLTPLIRKFAESNTDAAILVTYVENPELYGVAVFEGERLSKVVEKPRSPVSKWAITGTYVFGPVVFSAVENITPSARGELEITDAIQWLLDHDKNVAVVKTGKWWADAGTRANLIKTNRYLLETTQPGVSIGRHCTITNCRLIPPVVIGDDCQLDDAKVGPYVSIGNLNSIRAVQIENTILMDYVTLTNINPIISHSIIGNRAKVENLREGNSLELILGECCCLTGPASLNCPGR